MKKSPTKDRPVGERTPRRRRWAKRVLLAVLVLVLLRVVLGFTLAPIAVAAARAAGFDLVVERISLRVLGGELAVGGLVLTPAENAPAGPLVELDHLRIDVAMRALFGGVVRVERVDVDGVRLRVERDPDGRLVLPVGGTETESAATTDGEETTEASEPFDPSTWRSPVQLGALRATRLELRFDDRSVRPAAGAELQAELGLYDLGVEGLPTRLDVFARGRGVDGAPLLESASLVARLRQDGGLDAEVEGEVVGLVLEPLAGLLSAFGLTPDGQRRDGAFRATARVDSQVDGWSTQVEIGPAHWSVDGARWMALERAELQGRRVQELVDGASDGPAQWHVERAGAAGLRLRVERRADGLLAVAGLAVGAPKGPALFAPSSDGPTPNAPDAEPERSPPAPTWPSLVLRRLEAIDASVQFVDRVPMPAVELVASVPEASLLGLDWVHPDAGPARWLVRADANDVARGMRSEGELAFDGAALAADGALELEALELRAVAPYLAALGLHREGPDRRASGQISASLGQEPSGWSFGASLRELTLAAEGGVPDGRLDLVRWSGASVGADKLDLGAVDLEGGELRVELEPTGRWAFAGLVQGEVVPLPAPRRAEPALSPEAPAVTAAESAAPAPDREPATAAAAGDAGPPLTVDLTRLAASDLALVVAERGGTRRLEARLAAAAVGPLHWAGSEPTETPFRAHAEAPGVIESVVVDGRLRAHGPTLGMDGALRVDGLAVGRLGPYWPEGVPRPLWREGSLAATWTADLDLGPGGPAATLVVRDVALLEGGEQLGGLALLELGPARFAEVMDLGPLRLRGARLAGERRADGTVTVAGVALAGPEFETNRNQTPADESGRLGGGGGSRASESRGRDAAGEGADVGSAAGDDADGGTAAGSVAANSAAANSAAANSAAADGTAADGTAADGTAAEGTSASDAGANATLQRPTSSRASAAPVAEAGAESAPSEASARSARSAQTPRPAPADQVAPAATAVNTSADQRAAPTLPAPPSAAPALPALAVGPIELSDLALTWRDAIAGLETALVAEVDLARLDTQAGGEVALGVRAQLEGSADQLEASGTIRVDPADLRLDLDLVGAGLRAGPLAAYLPAGVFFGPDDRAARAQLRAGVTLAADGLRDLFVEVADAKVGPAEGDADLALRSLRTRVRHLASDQSAIDVEELVLEGLTLAAHLHGESGGVSALGFRWEPEAPAAAESAAEPAQTPAPKTTDDEPTFREATAEAAAAPAAPPGAVPRIHVGRFDLELAGLVIRDDAAAPDAAPFELRGRLATPGPLVLLDPTPQTLAPWQLAFTGSALPAVRAWNVDVTVAPYADEPRAEVTAGAEGLSSSALLTSLPSLERWVTAGALEDGTAAAKLTAELSWRRRGPLDFSLRDGFAAELELSGAELRATPGGERLVGLDDLFVDVRRYQPTTGDLHIASIEFERPSLRATLREDSLEVLGLRIPIPAEPDAADAESEPPQAESTDADAAPTPAEAETAAAPAATATTAGPLVRIDSIVGRGLDVELLDTTVTPNLRVPLNRLEFEVRGFTTRALVEPVPIGFALYLGADDVELPKRVPYRSLLGGLASAATSVLGGGGEEVELESRPLFGELAVVGRIAPAPVPVGWTRVELDGFELTGLRGAAAESGVKIGDGTLDFRARIDFEPDATIEVESNTSLTYLSLSEPAGGPISRYLRLPAPLDSVLYVLRNEDGEQRIPLRFSLDEKGLSFRDLASTVSKALGRLITDAVASSPMRLTGGLTDLVGLTGGGETEAADDAPEGAVTFPSGSILFDSRSASGLNTIAERLADDPELRVVLEHRFGASDLARAGRFANPSDTDTRELGRQLETRRSSLARRRAIAAVDVRSAYALGATEAAEARRRELVALDEELAASEDALDELYELLRPGADRRADRRTRAAALAVAALRQERVREALIARGAPEDEGRIEVRRARYEPDERELGAVLLFERGGTPKRGFFGRILGFFGL
ncbi:MAG: hypothetical protein GC161_16465 [Planctomycetaceae bacterium]|nr:hypothetical protein [Planctomycetaceae bacterium]